MKAELALEQTILIEKLQQKARELDHQLLNQYPDGGDRRRVVLARLAAAVGELGVEPAEQANLLGQVLEVLVRKHEGKQLGTFYTSPEVVQLMCRLALWNYLNVNQAEHPLDNNGAARLVFSDFKEHTPVTPEPEVLGLLKRVRVVDPAVGTGAFLLGMQHLLAGLRLRLGDHQDYHMICRQIAEHNLFGVDREAAAVETLALSLPAGLICGDSLLLDWPRAFPGVLESGGFDILITNPPYVSRGLIAAGYKADLTKRFISYGFSPAGRVDLYGFFFPLAAEILNSKGTAVLITSSSWLDVDYGTELQQYLLDNFDPVMLLDSVKERWFPAAGINTVVTLLSKWGEEGGRLTSFVSLRETLSDFPVTAAVVTEEAFSEGVAAEAAPFSQNSLPLAKLGPGKWGKYLRAPASYFDILKGVGDRFCTLGQIAEVRRGYTTGCNSFFYLAADSCLGIETKYLRPVIKSPKETHGFIISAEGLKHRVLLIQEPWQSLGDGVRQYIREAEEEGTHLRSTLKARRPWWSLGEKQFPNLIFRRFFNEKFNLPVLLEETAVDQTFYGIFYPGDARLLGAILNSTLSWLFIELHGRTPLGEGVLQYAVYEAAQLPVVNPAHISYEGRQELINAFEQLAKRKVLPLAEELGQSDRQQLDAIVFRELGLHLEAGSLQKRLYADLLQTVKNRLAKAVTVV